MWDGHPGSIKTADNSIEMPSPYNRPIHSAIYRGGPKAQESEKKKVDRLVKGNVIESGQMEWVSTVFTVHEKDGTVHYSVAYRKLKSVAVRDSHLLPKMAQCKASLVDAQVFLGLDANSAYMEIIVDEEDRAKRGPISHHGLHQFICADVTLKEKMCSFYTNGIDYFGSVARPGKLEVANQTADNIRKIQIPAILFEIKSFLDFLIYLVASSLALQESNHCTQKDTRRLQQRSLDCLAKKIRYHQKYLKRSSFTGGC